MKNTVDVYAEFDYQGASHKPIMTLDLDVHIKTLEDLSAIPVLLAKTNHIDSYSYQYEVLLDSQLCYANATGLAADFLVGSDFDFAGFLAVNSVDNVVTKLQKIAQEELGISDLSAHAALKQALLRAYHLDK
ncbi:MAG: hypothetical protein WC426_00590 [Sulfuriferula sp.]